MRRAAVLGVVILLWEAVSRAGWVNPLFVPSPSRIIAVLAELVRDGAIWTHFGTTLLEALVGLGLGIAIGGVLGLTAAVIRPLAEVLEPAMTLLNAVPRVILAPLFVIWLGIGVASKIALSLLLVTVTIFFAVYSGIREVDVRLVDRVRTLGGTRRDLVRDVYIPSVAAWLVGSLKIAVGFAFTGAVVGEFVASSRGLGYLLSFAQSTYNAALTFALIAVVAAVALSLFLGLEHLERFLLRWKRGGSGTRHSAAVRGGKTELESSLLEP